MIAVAVLLTVGRLFAADQSSFPADITHGNIRCVLMSVGQTTVFPNETDRGQRARETPSGHNGKLGVPCFTVTFLIEALGDAPSEPHTLKNLEVLSDGKSLRIAAGEHQQWFDCAEYQQWFDYDVF
jgi:hypothetical protein